MKPLKPLMVAPFENEDGEWHSIIAVIKHQIMPSLMNHGSRLFLISSRPLGANFHFLPLIDGFKVLRPRRQKLPEFIYVLSGQRYLWVNGKWLKLVEGQGAFVPEQVEYFPFGVANGFLFPCDSLSLIVHPEGGILVRTRLTQASYQRSVHFFVAQPILMQRYKGWRLSLPSHIADEIIVDMFEMLPELKPIGFMLISELKTQMSDFPFALKRAITLLHRAYNISITMTQLSRYSFVSEAQLYRLFRCWLGTSPYGYLTNLRMKIAKEFLTRTHLGVSDIAFLVGYSSRSMFSFNFHKVFGFSPAFVRYGKFHSFNPFTSPMKFAHP
ncbi:MAG: AraC family transcriptional regulator [Armatimonadetes bacterium]|nr:AraC family transcriptional regulator [Armatimonadota bacterium]MDW8028761.1 AraC family transcriptional regulator [Armatimonadota bacterium]